MIQIRTLFYNDESLTSSKKSDVIHIPMSYYTILQFQSKGKKVLGGRPCPEKSFAQKRSSGSKLGRFIQDRRSADPRGIQTIILEWRVDSKIVECRSSKNVLSVVVCALINKTPTFRNQKFKNQFVMNF